MRKMQTGLITRGHVPDHGTPFVDLFCGAGGLSTGFERAGFRAAFAVDNDAAAIDTFRLNHPSAVALCADIEKVTAKDVLRAVGAKHVPLIIGGPNCQGVSLRGKRDPDDPKNRMFFHFHRLIREIKPDWFVMENVPGLLHRHNLELAADIFQAFEEIGYRCGADVLLAADYGVPQLRYRLFLIGTRKKSAIGFPSPTHSCPFEQLGLSETIFSEFRRPTPSWRTVADAISDLPPLENGEGQEEVLGFFKPKMPSGDFLRWCRQGERNLYNHRCHKTNAANIALIKHIPQGKNWKSIPPDIRPRRFDRVALKDHTTTYGRLRWDMPARTVTTYFNNITCGAFTHPEQHRGISVREGARLQSFPDSFQFTGPLARQYRQVGNAVPSLLASRVAETVYELMADAAVDEDLRLSAAVEFSRFTKKLVFRRPVKGMRFNLDKHALLG